MASRVIAVQAEDQHYDSLDGKQLVEGLKLYIKWPSGGVQQVSVEIRTVIVGTLRDSQVVEVPYHKAYFRIGAPGIEACLPLLGFVAQRACAT